MDYFIGLDPGSKISGLSVAHRGIVEGAWNLEKDALFCKLTELVIKKSATVVIEDIRPYFVRLTPQVIDTCKLIGELEYRLKKEVGVPVNLVARNTVKKWIFDTFPDTVLPIIHGKIGRSGKERKASFVWIDDKCVTESMKFLYGIRTPPPGKGYQFGLKDHSWQALAVAAYFSFSSDEKP